MEHCMSSDLSAYRRHSTIPFHHSSPVIVDYPPWGSHNLQLKPNWNHTDCPQWPVACVCWCHPTSLQEQRLQNWCSYSMVWFALYNPWPWFCRYRIFEYPTTLWWNHIPKSADFLNSKPSNFVFALVCMGVRLPNLEHRKFTYMTFPLLLFSLPSSLFPPSFQFLFSMDAHQIWVI